MKTSSTIAAVSIVISAATAALAQPERYYLTELGTLGGDESVARDVNHAGSRNASGVIRGFLWRDGTMIDIGSLEPGAETKAFAINNRDEVVGISGDLPFYWKDGVMTEIPNYSVGWPDQAVDINDEGRVVWSGSGAEGGFPHSHYWYPGMNESIQLVEPASFENADVMGLNNLGQMTGRGLTHGDPSVAWRATTSSWTMLPSGLGGNAIGYGINDLGWVAGVLTDGAGTEWAFYWDGSSQRVMSQLPGHNHATAFDINNEGLTVGCAEEHWLVGPRRAFVADGSLVDLNTRVANGSDLILRKAHAISEPGSIVGYGTVDNGAERQAFLATPIPDEGLLLMPDATDELVHVLHPSNGAPLGSFDISYTRTPMEIIDGNANELLLSDRYRNKIYRLDASGALIGTFFTALFYEFRGLELAPNGDVIAASTGGLRRFTSSGTEIWQKIGDEIRDVALVDSQGRDELLASNVDRATLQSFDLNLVQHGETTPGDVLFPEQVTRLPNDRIVSASYGTQSVIILDQASGQPLIEIRTEGRPRGVIVLDDTTLLISTTLGLYHYTQSGTYLRTIMTGKGFWYLSQSSNFAS